LNIRFHDVAQNTEAWDDLKLAVPSASNMHRVITKVTRKPSKQRYLWAYELAGQKLAGERLERGGVGLAAERGHLLEPAARDAYREIANGVPVSNGGWVTRELGHDVVGASPDGMVGSTGLVEIKCLSYPKHLQIIDTYHREGAPPEEFWIQIQGQLYVTGREWCDLWLYHPHPNLPNLRVHIPQDEEFLEALEPELLWVLVQRDAIVKRMREVV